MSLFSFEREPRLELPALTRTAKGQPCTLLVPNVCFYLKTFGNTETTVWAHSNFSEHGKGVGLKAHDCFGAYACVACHNWLDRGRDPERREVFQKGMERTLYLLWKNGRLKVVS